MYGNPPNPSGTGLAVPSSVSSVQPDGSLPAQPANPQSSSQPGIELGALRIVFKTEAIDIDSPPLARIRVFNLSDATVTKIKNEFQSLTLQAGYENGNFGVIFQGTIIRIRRGRIDNLNSFIDILASNLDAIYNFGVVNTTLKAGSTPQQQVAAVQKSVNSSPVAQGSAGALAQGMQMGNIPNSFNTGGTLPRGKVMFGLARTQLGKIADTAGAVWSIGPDGKINFHELTGFLPGEAVSINAATGMIGVPEATPQGVEVSCLLNPQIKTGTQIKLNNADITQTTNQNSSVGFPAYGDFQFFANTSSDGTYASLVVEHEGDNRGSGDDFKTSIVALAVDATAGAGQVAAYG